jgi:hypothetical protein
MGSIFNVEVTYVTSQGVEHSATNLPHNFINLKILPQTILAKSFWLGIKKNRKSDVYVVVLAVFLG